MAERLYGRDPPDVWVPGTGFMEDSFSKDGVGWGGGGAGDGFRMILISSIQPRSPACTVHRRVRSPMRI